MSLSNKALDRIETWTSRLRGRQIGLPSIDGRMSVAESELAVEARYGIANSFEETDRLQEALQRYHDLEASYPTPGVIKLRIKSVEKRLKSGETNPEKTS